MEITPCDVDTSQIFTTLICKKIADGLNIQIINDLYLDTTKIQLSQTIHSSGQNANIPCNNIRVLIREGVFVTYKLNKLDRIKYIDEEKNVTTTTDLKKIYEDEGINKCLICLDLEKDTIFYPCGHYYCCDNCAKKIKECPVCRNEIVFALNKLLINN
jgi:hypothetical protein